MDFFGKAGGAVLILYSIICAIEDVRTRRIDLVLSLGFAAAGLLISVCIRREVSDMLLAMLPAIAVLAAAVISGGCIGTGDAVFLGVCGLFLSAERTACAAAAGFGACALYSLAVIIIGLCSRKRRKTGESLPFAAFMLLPTAAAGVMNIVFGI